MTWWRMSLFGKESIMWMEKSDPEQLETFVAECRTPQEGKQSCVWWWLSKWSSQDSIVLCSNNKRVQQKICLLFVAWWKEIHIRNSLNQHFICDDWQSHAQQKCFVTMCWQWIVFCQAWFWKKEITKSCRQKWSTKEWQQVQVWHWQSNHRETKAEHAHVQDQMKKSRIELRVWKKPAMVVLCPYPMSHKSLGLFWFHAAEDWKLQRFCNFLEDIKDSFLAQDKRRLSNDCKTIAFFFEQTFLLHPQKHWFQVCFSFGCCRFLACLLSCVAWKWTQTRMLPGAVWFSDCCRHACSFFNCSWVLAPLRQMTFSRTKQMVGTNSWKNFMQNQVCCAQSGQSRHALEIIWQEQRNWSCCRRNCLCANNNMTTCEWVKEWTDFVLMCTRKGPHAGMTWQRKRICWSHGEDNQLCANESKPRRRIIDGSDCDNKRSNIIRETAHLKKQKKTGCQCVTNKTGQQWPPVQRSALARWDWFPWFKSSLEPMKTMNESRWWDQWWWEKWQDSQQDLKIATRAKRAAKRKTNKNKQFKNRSQTIAADEKERCDCGKCFHRREQKRMSADGRFICVMKACVEWWWGWSMCKSSNNQHPPKWKQCSELLTRFEVFGTFSNCSHFSTLLVFFQIVGVFQNCCFSDFLHFSEFLALFQIRCCHFSKSSTFQNLLVLSWNESTLIPWFSITAELLAGARTLRLADRHHFDFNLSDLLDKSMQHKRNWLLNVIAARQRFERHKLTLKAFKLSPWPIPNWSNGWLQDELHGVLPQPCPSRCPIPWAHLSPQLAGTKDAISSAEDNHLQSLWRVKLFARISNSHGVCMIPQRLHKTSNESVETAPTRQINPSKMQHDGVPTMWSALLWHLLHFALLSFLSQTEPFLPLTLLRFWQWPTTQSFKDD